jgi:hypothetical protein
MALPLVDGPTFYFGRLPKTNQRLSMTARRSQPPQGLIPT